MRRGLIGLLLSAPLAAACAAAATTSPAPGAVSGTNTPADTRIAAGAVTAADAWLDRFSQSMNDLTYRGVLTYERGDRRESLRITHTIVGGAPYERLEHLDGASREVIRRGDRLTCIYLGQRLNRLLESRAPAGGAQRLAVYYDLRTDGEGRVAGRRTMNIRVVPRDEYRFGYRLALDYATGLLLRSELLAADGRVLERFQFVEIDIGQPLEQTALADATPAAVAATATAPAPARIDTDWRPGWLPPGFTAAAAPPAHADMLTYSDGLAVLSVFLEPAAAAQPAAEGRARQGATVAYTRPLHSAGKTYIVTVVGEVPQATAERVANSLSLGPQ